MSELFSKEVWKISERIWEKIFMTNEKLDFDNIISAACKKSIDIETEQYNTFFNTEAVVSSQTNSKLNRIMNATLFKYSKAYMLLKRGAIACVIVLAVIVGTYVTVEPVKAYIDQLFEKWFDNSIEIEFIPESDKYYPTTFEEHITPILEEGWSIEQLSPGEPTGNYIITTSDNQTIRYSQALINTGIWIDDSEHIKENITLKNGITAYLYIYSDGYSLLMWENRYIFSISGWNIDENTLIHFANTIK